MKAITLGVVLLAGAIAGIFGWRTARQGYETAAYTVVRTEGKFEVRDYPALTVVETAMSGGSGGSFNRLFAFISGRNEGNQKIAMTTPVFMTGSTMAFVMPAHMKAPPVPVDGAVAVRKLPAGRFAVLQYSGKRSRPLEEQKLAELQSWMASQGLPVLSEPVFGYFDPPWTPPFMRRNEVMVRTEFQPSTK